MNDYPGSDYKMSTYGVRVYNPCETEGHWVEGCKVVVSFVYVFSFVARSLLSFVSFWAGLSVMVDSKIFELYQAQLNGNVYVWTQSRLV